MAKPTGFLEQKRKEPGYRPVEERIRDYKDVARALASEEVRVQASRCMDCSVPFCHSIGCPLSNLIPEWNDLVYHGQWEEALKRLEKSNPFPEITGRICPAPCETSCTLSINDSPVTIRQVELAIVEYGFAKGFVRPKTPEKEIPVKIAVVGSGPAGLAAAQGLRQKGYDVTVYEKSPKAGGILRYGIPDFKLEKWVLDRRIDLMKQAGIRFETGVNIGEDISAAYLKSKYQMIFLAVGTGQPRDLAVPGRELGGVHFAMEYLYQSNEFVSGARKPDALITAKGKNVLVIGGGDTGSDCIGTANRQGAKKVYQFELLPKPMDWEKTWNPVWPDWPVILRTSSSHKEGAERDWSIGTKKFTGSGGRITDAHFVRLEWRRPADGGPAVMKEIPGSEFSLKVDLVFLAMGFLHAEHNRLLKDLAVDLDGRGNIVVTDGCRTSRTGIFAVGDAVSGASLVVRAMQHGRNAAEKASPAP
jgi:glutamate synthase (NADPH/NADH) small chain